MNRTTRHTLKRYYFATRIPRLREYMRRRNQRKAVFVWIPKVAGTSLVHLLNPSKYRHLYKVEYRFAEVGFVTFDHLDYAELVKQGYVSREFDREAFKFAFVRNPYDRAVSLYFYLQKLERVPAEDSFLTFCRHLKAVGHEPIGLYNDDGLSHCNPQVRWLENTRMDFIGRFESLEQDVRRIQKELNQEERPLPVLNKSKRSSYGDYYCEESRAIVQELYDEDFRSFDYDPTLLEIRPG